MKDFLMFKALGVTKSDANMNAEMTIEEMTNYANFAFDDAKTEAIAQKIGKAMYISDTNNNNNA